MIKVTELGSGFEISVSGRLVFVRHWGIMTCALGREFARCYKEETCHLLHSRWAEVIDLMEAVSIEPGRGAEVASLFEVDNLQNNVATAYIVSERTAADHLRDLEQLMATQTASFADQFFRNPIDALNWVNQRLAAAV
jgi:hypothetical protein